MMKKKEIKLRVNEEIYKQIKEESDKRNMSINSLLVHVIVNNLGDIEEKYQDIVSRELKEKKSISSAIRLTKTEAEILNKYAKANGWKLTEEIRYRVVGTMSQSEVISGEELKIIREMRSSINALVTNMNSILREGKVLDQDGKEICKKLADIIKEAIIRIEKIVEKSKARFLAMK